LAASMLFRFLLSLRLPLRSLSDALGTSGLGSPGLLLCVHAFCGKDAPTKKVSCRIPLTLKQCGSLHQPAHPTPCAIPFAFCRPSRLRLHPPPRRRVSRRRVSRRRVSKRGCTVRKHMFCPETNTNLTWKLTAWDQHERKERMRSEREHATWFAIPYFFTSTVLIPLPAGDTSKRRLYLYDTRRHLRMHFSGKTDAKIARLPFFC
jgi:hypothetical protein